MIQPIRLEGSFGGIIYDPSNQIEGIINDPSNLPISFGGIVNDPSNLIGEFINDPSNLIGRIINDPSNQILPLLHSFGGRRISRECQLKEFNHSDIKHSICDH